MHRVSLYTDEEGNWIANVRKAIEVYIEALEQDGLPVPLEG